MASVMWAHMASVTSWGRQGGSVHRGLAMLLWAGCRAEHRRGQDLVKPGRYRLLNIAWPPSLPEF